MNNKVLMIAFHFPPFTNSSGVQRTLRFVQYLPDYEWTPIALTAHPRAHEKTSTALDNECADTKVVRAFALDTARHLSIKGRYLNWLALPDRWFTWILGAIPEGKKLINQYKPRVIWSTYPIASAHYIAWALHRLSGIPWVADFRDPMVEQNAQTLQWAPANKNLRNARLWIEKRAVKYAARLVFCTEGAKNICIERYPEANHKKWVVISNGYDEKTFAKAEEKREKDDNQLESNKVTLLHSGVLYFSPDRDPSYFFDAISSLKLKEHINSTSLKIILRASGNETIYQKLINKKNIADIVKLEPAIDYNQALEEMMNVDGLLIFQGSTSNPAIPAKVYEYMRAKKPILSMADDKGETAKLMISIGMTYVTPLNDADAIENKLLTFLQDIKENQANTIDKKVLANYSRQSLTRKLANILQKISMDS